MPDRLHSKVSTSSRWRVLPAAGLCLSLALLQGCASTAVQSCKAIAGPGWSVMDEPPSNADDLLALQGLPKNTKAVWLQQSPKHVLACYYSGDLINPGCTGTTAYGFVKERGGWKTTGTYLDPCDLMNGQ